MNTQTLFDRANAPTSNLGSYLIERAGHQVATLGRNRIIYDHHRTNYFTTGHAGYERVTKVLPRPSNLNIFRTVINLINKIRREFFI